MTRYRPFPVYPPRTVLGAAFVFVTVVPRLVWFALRISRGRRL